MTDPFATLPRGHFKAIYADPPWHFKPWADYSDAPGIDYSGTSRATENHYGTMALEDIGALPVSDLAAPDCVLFMWVIWPMLDRCMGIISDWGFQYKTCAFAWTKADARQAEFFHDDVKPWMGLGFWTRSNSEVCLLATRGKPKRQNSDVRQAIIEPRRQHSRKPDCVPSRIERLVEGPYLELFARTQRPGWTVWGNQTDRFKAVAA